MKSRVLCSLLTCGSTLAGAEETVTTADLDAAQVQQERRLPLALQMATVSGIASGVLIVRGNQLRSSAQEALRRYDRLLQLEQLTRLSESLHRYEDQLQDANFRAPFVADDLEVAGRLADPGSTWAQSARQSYEATQRELRDLPGEIARARSEMETLGSRLGLASPNRDAIRRLTSEARSDVLVRLSSLQSEADFQTSSRYFRHPRRANLSSSHLPSSMRTQLLSRAEAQRQTLRRLGNWGLGATTLLAVSGAWNAYSDGVSGSEPALAEQFDHLEEGANTSTEASVTNHTLGASP
jgi:hypothetical protein